MLFLVQMEITKICCMQDKDTCKQRMSRNAVKLARPALRSIHPSVGQDAGRRG